MLDILLIVVIGGMGTMYGAVIGAVLFVLAQNYLQDLLKLGARRAGRRAGAVAAGLARPLAAVAGRAVRAVGLPLPDRRRRAAARCGALRTDDAPPRTTSLPARPRAALHRVGRAARRDGDRLARPGAHRARHGRHRRAPGAALPRDLPRHHRPRPEPVEPAAGRRSTAWPSTRSWPPSLVDQLGIEQLPLARHLDGRRDRHGGRGRPRCAAASGAWCSTTSARSWPTRRSSASAAMPAARRPSPR